MKRFLTATALALAAALTLSACGNTGSDATASTSSNAATYNDADVTFAQQMIPHHQQAVQMARMAETRASTKDVKALAPNIEAAQTAEISAMKYMLTELSRS